MPDTPSNISYDQFDQDYRDQELHKIAKAVLAKWPSLVGMMTWEDVHAEGCIATQKARAKGGAIQNRKAFHYTMCHRYCYKAHHQLGGPIDPIELLLMGADGAKTSQWELLVTMLYQFGMPCGLLLFLFYLANPPVKDKERLFQIAVFFGAGLRNSDGMDTKMWECRKKFAAFAAQHPDFDDLFF